MKAPCDPVRAVIDDPYLLHKIMLINVHTELLATAPHRLLRQHLKDHMTKMSRAIDIIYAVGSEEEDEYWPGYFYTAWALESPDILCRAESIKPDHTPPEPAVLDRVAKSIANMK
jgi:hypothetical protein